MKTYNRICLKDYTVKDNKQTFKLKRGVEYLTSKVDNDCVTVFSLKWLQNIPVAIFSSAERYT